MSPLPTSRTRGAVSGFLAAGAALATAQLASSVWHAMPSLIGSVGDAVIRLAPRWLVEAGISGFGRNDKRALVIGIVLVCLAIASLLGVAGRQHPLRVKSGFVLAGTVGGLAAVSRDGTAVAAAVIAAALATGAGIAVLEVFRRSADQPESQAADAFDDSRRRFLVTSTAAAALILGTVAVGGLVARGARSVAARARVILPRAASPLPPVAATFDDIVGLSPLVTPSPRFYRIDTAITIPDVDLDSWRLDVKGMVRTPVSLTYDDLLAMPLVERDTTLACVSNEVGGSLVGTARWLGVPLGDVLALAGPLAGATQVVARSVDGFTAGFPAAVVDDGRTALVAVGMNGEPLPVLHGFPARIVVAGLYGYVSATKWLRELELTTWDAYNAFWVQRGWAKEGPVKTQSRIDVPRDRAELHTGPVTVAGVAWAPVRGVAAVDVRVDSGRWLPAELVASIGPESWRQWRWQWNATPGSHVIEVRATDGSGKTQPSESRPPFPDGATGNHAVTVNVRGS